MSTSQRLQSQSAILDLFLGRSVVTYDLRLEQRRTYLTIRLESLLESWNIREDIRMENMTFDEFVSRQLERAPEKPSINWEEERDQWLAHLARLYSRIEFLLSKYISSRRIRLEYQPVELNEEYIGSYAAKRMILRIGRQEVVLVPVGTLLVGSKGRVDVIGPAGRAEMLLVDSKAPGAASVFFRVKVGPAGRLLAPSESPQAPEIEWEWRILSRPPERRFVEITQESLFQLIMDVANG